MSENTVIEEGIEVKPYTLRKLGNGDLWSIWTILSKMLPDDSQRIFIQLMSKKATVKEVGYRVVANLAMDIIKNVPRAQNEVDEFCASMAGVTVEELNEMPFGTTPMIIMDIVEDAKGASFFKVLSKLIS